jgi:LuxR family maltose regulon positive regulatory protein
VFWTSYAHYFLGVVAYEQNRLDEAEACFRRLGDLRYIVPSRAYEDALIGLSLVAWARADEQASGAFCRAARAYSHEVGDPTSLRIISSFELRLAVLRDLPLPDGLEPPPADDHTSAWLEVPTVTWAMRLIADPVRRVRESALDFVDDALARMQRHHNRRLVVVLSILRALALDVRGQREAALESLAETVRLAKARGLVRSFVDCGPQMRELLGELAKRPGSSGYVTTLCAAFDRGEPRRGPRVSDAFGPSEILTFRELETLELLAWRMTNKEIADRLSITSAAIKKRLESIYAKLDVHDRRAAVAEAAARGLIDPPAR